MVKENPIPPIWIARHEDGRMIGCIYTATKEEAEQEVREKTDAKDIVIA